MAISQGNDTTLGSVPDTGPREHAARRVGMEVEEATVSNWEESTQMTIKGELHAVSPEVSLRLS